MSDTMPSDHSAEARLSAWCAEQRARADLTAAALPANKAVLFDALANAGITAVIVEFDGSCDDGQIESVTAQAGDTLVGLPADLVILHEPRRDVTGLEDRTCPVAEAIETMAYAFLEETHAGWEINDGAFGTFTFDVAARSIRLDHHERVMETEYSEHVF